MNETETAPCICSIRDLMVSGCTCGAMEAEREAKQKEEESETQSE